MKKKILVVDDSATVRSLHGYIFKSQGFDVETACNGVEAIEKLYSSGDIAVVVVDINMPKMDGIQFTKIVRKNGDYTDLPIIIVSSEKEEGDVKKGIEAGANIYLVKPSKPEQLVTTVRMLLGG